MTPISAPPTPADQSGLQSFYTIDDLVQRHRFSRRTIIRLYENEKGVQTLARPAVVSNHSKKDKRRYRSFRVPHHVYARVVARLEGR